MTNDKRPPLGGAWVGAFAFVLALAFWGLIFFGTMVLPHYR